MWYLIFRKFFFFIFHVLYKFRVEGRENIPRKTNFIAVANHTSFLDAQVLGAAIPFKINFVAVRLLYRIPWLRWYLRLMEALPTGSASGKVTALLLNGKNVGLFSEGGVSRDGNLKEFRRGAALLALKTGRPILPCAILGTYQSLPITASFPKFFLPIKVKIGKPIYVLKEFDDIFEDMYLREWTHKIRNAVKELIDGG